VGTSNAPGKYFYAEIRQPQRPSGVRIVKVVAKDETDARHLAEREGEVMVVRDFRQQLRHDPRVVHALKGETDD